MFVQVEKGKWINILTINQVTVDYKKFNVSYQLAQGKNIIIKHNSFKDLEDYLVDIEKSINPVKESMGLMDETLMDIKNTLATEIYMVLFDIWDDMKKSSPCELQEKCKKNT